MRPVTFSELTRLYFEGYSAVWARKQMLRLLLANPVLKAEFEGVPYRHRGFRFTPARLTSSMSSWGSREEKPVAFRKMQAAFRKKPAAFSEMQAAFWKTTDTPSEKVSSGDRNSE